MSKLIDGESDYSREGGDMDIFTSLLVLLLNPTMIAFVWWPVALITYFMFKVFQPLRSTFVLFLEERGGNVFVTRTKWIKSHLLTYRLRKGESHTLKAAGDDGASPFMWPSMLGPQPAIMQFTKSTRPAKVDIQNPEHSLKRKSYNPDSQAFDDFMEEEAYRQGEMANKVNRPELGLIVLAALAAFLAGVVLSPSLAGFMAHPATQAATP